MDHDRASEGDQHTRHAKLVRDREGSLDAEAIDVEAVISQRRGDMTAVFVARRTVPRSVTEHSADATKLPYERDHRRSRDDCSGSTHGLPDDASQPRALSFNCVMVAMRPSPSSLVALEPAQAE